MTREQTSIGKKKSFKLFDFLYKYGTIITILLLIFIFTAVNPAFIDGSNIVNILRSISIVTIIAIGVTISLSVNGFDLSVGSTASFANAIAISMFVWYSQNIFMVLIAVLAAALVIGALNSLLIVKLKIPDMLTTLAMMFIIQGVALTYTKGATVSQNMVMSDGTYATGTISPIFEKMGQVPWIILVMLVVVCTCSYFSVLYKTWQVYVCHWWK